MSGNFAEQSTLRKKKAQPCEFDFRNREKNGWDDDRHCAVGLLRSSRDWSHRTLDASLLAELRIQQTIREQNSFARAELPETQEPALC